MDGQLHAVKQLALRTTVAVSGSLRERDVIPSRCG